ncbi:hypothetical protein HYX04_05530, partial [Candidatus Woesearchaeota archaeon]|nr:hypothetical protein [Candidatus Woesearchaeota archaeon]
MRNRKLTLIIALIVFSVLSSINAFAVQDFIIENRTSALFVVNGTTGNIFMAPSFGLVGIGTATPSHKLDVYGNVSIKGNLSVDSNLSVDGNTLFVDSLANRVGIGTTTPNYPLQIHLASGASGTSGIRLSTADGSGVSGGLVAEFGTGGGTALDSTIFNINNGYLRFGTNNAERIRIDSNGLVGINATAAETLDIIGTLRIRSGQSGNAQGLFQNAAGNVGIGTTSPYNTLTVVGSISANSINASSINTTGSAYFATSGVGTVGINTTSPAQTLTVQGTLNVTPPTLGSVPKGFFVASNGYVGIGTSTPERQLVINGTDGFTGLNIVDGNLNNMLMTHHSTRDEFAFGQVQDRPIRIFTNNNVAQGILITSTGVGIGMSGNTMKPATALHITGGSPEIRMNDSTGGGRVGLKTNSVANTDFDIQQNGTSRIYINPNGNVGIGTTSPYNTLTVVGSVGVSGSLNASSINTTGNAYFATSSGSVGIGTTGPQNKLEVIGAATFAGGVNASSLNVTGFSITDDSLVTLSDGSKKKIKDIKAGEEVLTLEEKTGKLVPRKVNALLDHGIKPIYEMATEDGRAINTTAEHPYFVRGLGYIRNLNGVSTNSLPLNSDGLTLSNKSDKAFVTVLMTGGTILMNTIPSCSPGGNSSILPKCLSKDKITLTSAFAIADISPSSEPRGARFKSNLLSKNSLTSLGMFSSDRSLNLSDGDISFLFKDLGGIVHSREDGFFSELREVVPDDFVNSDASAYQGEYLPYHNSGAFESEHSMTDFAVSNNKLINFGSHNIDNDNSVYKTFDDSDKLGRWIEVRYLKEGMEIAVPDYSTNTIKWEKIASIKALEPQHVYDLNIEGTRNFIANDIVAHNTYLATSSGNKVGIGKTNPATELDVAGGINASTLNISGNAYLATQSGNVGIGTTSPNIKLEVNGTGTTFSTNGSVGIGTTNLISGDKMTIVGGNLSLGSNASNTNQVVRIIGEQQTGTNWATQLRLQTRSDSVGNPFTDAVTFLGNSQVATFPGVIRVDGTGNSYITGNLGIRTTSPTHALDIYGNVSIKGNLSVDSNFSVKGSDLFVDATNDRVGIGTTSPYNTLTVVGSISANSINATSINTTGSAYFATSSGSVGIGTTTPTDKLHVAGAARIAVNDTNNVSTTNVLTLEHFTQTPLNSTGGIGVGLLFRAIDNGSNVDDVALINATLVNALNGSEASSIGFYTRTGGGALTPRLFVNGSNVGIGTTSPNQKLVVVGGVNITGGLNVTGLGVSTDNTNYPLVIQKTSGELITDTTLVYNPGGDSMEIGSVNPTVITASSIRSSNTANLILASANINPAITIPGTAGNTIKVATGVDVAGPLNATTINTTGGAYFATSSGSVGIGTTSPSEKLTVIGNVNISGYLNISGDLVVNKQFNVSAS